MNTCDSHPDMIIVYEPAFRSRGCPICQLAGDIASAKMDADKIDADDNESAMALYELIVSLDTSKL